jgi:hypothetical protein
VYVVIVDLSPFDVKTDSKLLVEDVTKGVVGSAGGGGGGGGVVSGGGGVVVT